MTLNARQATLFNISAETSRDVARRPDGWSPDAIPELRGERRVILDFETTGLRWWDGDRAVGAAYLLPESGRRGYLPFRHRGGGNLPEEQVLRWLRTELRAVHIDNANTKFDLHIARSGDGIDFDAQGCTFGDVEHHAALLDDYRMRFGLEILAKDVLGPHRGKVELPVSGAAIADLPAWLVAPYAVEDVTLVHDIMAVTRPQLAEQDLLDVLALEEAIIPVVVEMETNGTYLDMPLLEEWRTNATKELHAILWSIYRETGVMLRTPDASKDLFKLFQRLHLPITTFTPTGQPSFTENILKSYNHPVLSQVIHAGHLADLKSKYLDKYAATANADGWIRFNLHQLRGEKEEGGKRGAVSGRFSAAGDREGGYNPQQVVSVEKQLERGWCPNFPVRKLFKPGSPEQLRLNPKLCWVAADAKQIEYRLFAHYANSQKIIDAYHAPPPYVTREIGGKLTFLTGPDADYHAVVMELLQTVNPRLNRKLVKNVNFAKIYGAGLTKFAYMIGVITEAQYEATIAKFDGRPKLNDLLYRSDYPEQFREALGVNNVYDEMFPDVKPMLRKASQVAEHRGYVKDLIGRRARLLDRFHSALNRIIQGGAASVNKRVLVETYKERKRLDLTMFLTVHDELGGALEEPAKLPELRQVLDTQYFNLRVPILWDAAIGENWAACK